MRFPIQFLQLPAARFTGRTAIDACAHAAGRYETAVADFDLTGDEAELWGALAALGYEPDEIAWHVERPGERMVQGYA